MRTTNCLEQLTSVLTAAGIGTARLDALVLLEDVTGRDRAWLLAHPEHELSPRLAAKLEKLLKQRAKHVPLAYVRGRTEFYGRTFVISPVVLEPRPESETMIECLKRLVKSQAFSTHGPKNISIADVGAGSGALGITAALELPGSQIELLEVDPAALKIAKINVEKFTPPISVIESDLLTRSSQQNDILLCNLPYVPDDYQINRAAAHEPRLAIFGGPDGLDVYRKLFKQVKNGPKQPLFILTESLPPQHEALQAIAQQSNYDLLETDDFIQVFQFKK